MKSPAFVRAEGDGGACALSGDTRRLAVLIGKDDVVLGAFAVDQGKFDHLALGGGQHRIDLAVDGAADAEIDHSSFRNAGSQRVFGVRRSIRRRAPGAPCGAWFAAAGGVCFARCGRLLLRRPALSAGCRRGEVGDDVGAIVVGLETGERHFVSRERPSADRSDKRPASWHPKRCSPVSSPANNCSSGRIRPCGP